MSELEEFAARIAQERREKASRDRRDISQKDVADAVGTTNATVSRWESALNFPDNDALVKLAKYFGVTRAWLRFGQLPREAPLHDPREQQGPSSLRRRASGS